MQTTDEPKRASDDGMVRLGRKAGLMRKGQGVAARYRSFGHAVTGRRVGNAPASERGAAPAAVLVKPQLADAQP